MPRFTFLVSNEFRVPRAMIWLMRLWLVGMILFALMVAGVLAHIVVWTLFNRG